MLKQAENENITSLSFFNRPKEKHSCYLASSSDKGNIYIYKEEDFAFNQGLYKPDQKVPPPP